MKPDITEIQLKRDINFSNQKVKAGSIFRAKKVPKGFVIIEGRFEGRTVFPFAVKDIGITSICQLCVYRYHPIMMSSYCIKEVQCPLCGRVSDLALIRWKEDK